MNREILFRGKRADNGEWVYGYPVGWQNEGGDISIVDSRFGACIDESGNLMMLEAPFVTKVDPSTICEYTGLTDRNGKKIFEGDILRQKTTDKFKQYNDFEWERYGIVRFGEHDFRPDYAGYSTICFYVESIKSVAINPLNHAIGGMSNGINQYYALDENYPYEVIGNIFDHPELLEENNT